METKRCPGCMQLKTQSPVCEHCGYDERQDNQPNQLPIGTMLRGQYRLGRVLGQGGFGITYMGWDTALDMPVAVKEFFPSGMVSRNNTISTCVDMSYGSREEAFGQTRERFLREAKILGMLGDIPGIVRVHNLFMENNTAYIVMEYIRGIDLRDYLQKNGRLSVPQVLAILKPVISSVGRLHETNLVHRDISPDNIMIQQSGAAKLLDFGAVSIVANADAQQDLNHSTMAILKKGFAPMEQYQTRGSLGPWTDVYAMCATIYYCLTGKVPADAHDRLMDGAAIGWDKIPGLTPHQAQVLERGMAILPKDRISSMKELERCLYDGEQLSAPVVPDSAVVASIPGTSSYSKSSYSTSSAPAMQSATHHQVTEEKASAQPEQKAPPKKKKRFPILLLVVVLLLGLAAGAAFVIPARMYTDAETLFDDGQYQQAAAAFEKISFYKDSSDRITECDYAWAKAVYDTGDYEQAHTLFTNLDGYQDSNTMQKACIYGMAGNAYSGGDYAEAVRLYTSLGDYKDSAKLAADAELAGKRQKAKDLLEEGKAAAAAILYYNIGDKKDSLAIWETIADREVVSAGGYHTLGLKEDGTVYLAGRMMDDNCNPVPDKNPVSKWKHIVAVSAGSSHSVGLREDGTVVATGENKQGQCDVESWTDVVAIAAGELFTMGLRADGTVLYTGDKTATAAGKWTNVAQICAGGYRAAALTADGKILSAGGGSAVSGGRDFKAISIGVSYFTGIQQNGTVNIASQKWTNVVAVSCKGWNVIAVKSDGTAVAAGFNEDGQCKVDKWKDIIDVSASIRHAVALKSDGTAVAVGSNLFGRCNVTGWRNLKVPGK